MWKFFFALLLPVSLVFTALSQEYPNASTLNLKEIMKGSDFIGHLPSSIHWDITGQHILFDWNPESNPGDETYSYDTKTKQTAKISPDFYMTSADYDGESMISSEYFSHQGALYHFDAKDGKTHLLYRGTSPVHSIKNREGSKYVYFREGEEVRAFCKADHCIETIFVFKEGAQPQNETEQDHWSHEEAQLFQFIRDEEKQSEWNQAQRKEWSHEIPSYYYGKESVSNVQVSTDGRFLTFQLYTAPNVETTHVEHHISKDGHSYSQPARPKVHSEDPNNRLGIYDFERDSTYFVDFSTLSDIRKKPEYLKLYGDNTSTYEADRNIIMHSMIYSNVSEKNVLDVRSYDNKDRWIVSVDLMSGAITELEHQHDEAWIGGPGISSWNMVSGVLGWMKDGKTIYFQSEETGYSHLYTLNTTTGEKTALTTGKWEVQSVQLNHAGTTFFLTTNETHPGDKGFYHLSIASRKLTPILTKEGAHEISISPDEKWLAVRYSNKTKPWELYLAPNKPGATLQQLTHSTTKTFDQYTWYAPEVIQFKAADGVPVNARLYEPENGKKNNAAVIFVHGAGYLQNAHNWWSTYYREYMFHNLLRDNGFTVLDIDYRASAGYGRDHRTAIYRHMGGKDLSDQIDGRQWLIDSLEIDPDKVGIYGGSYGGFITLMALLTEPGKFQGGAALRSVTDWYHYNHEYTSNILNYPTTDTIAYEQSAPIYFADNLEDRLLMLHGMVDDNVQFQDVVRLSQRFIELGKTNWELAVFPVEAHGFEKSYSWADEYRRIYELFMDELILKPEE